MKLKLAVFSTLIMALLVLPGVVSASEGTFTMRNRVGEAARCYATSVLMPDNDYQVLISCRDILYPGGTSVFNYVVWATPVDGGNPFRLGTLGVGKVEYDTDDAFSSLFVTKETTNRPRSPSGTVVMSGNLETIDFLDNPTGIPQPDENELGEPETTPSPIPTQAPRNLGRVFAAGGVLAFIALFGVILVIFVLTRRR